jgi:type IV secretion system protein VirD4
VRDDDLLSRVVLPVAAVIGSIGGVTWLGAWFAVVLGGGIRLDAGLGDAVVAAVRLPGSVGNPEGAWPRATHDALPGPFAYWTGTALALVVVAAIAAGVLWLWQRVQRPGTVPRKRLGVDARARFARLGDLGALVVPGPVRGRFILGRTIGLRPSLLATECRATTEPSRHRATKARQGDTGAVALVGPSRSGKTVAAVAGILEWEGPCVLSSVKADLMAATIGWRAQRGEVRVYDPLGLTGYAGAGWSPLAQATTITGARRAARNLLDAVNDDGTENLGMWKNLAEYLMAGLFWVAAMSGRDMSAVLEWVLTQDRPRPDAASEVEALLRELLATEDDDVRSAADLAFGYLLSTWDQDDRPRSSVYITAQAALSAFSDPAIASSTTVNEIDLDWLMSGESTVYVCAPLKDQSRLAPAFGGLLNDLLGQVYEWSNRSPEGRLDQQLLLVVDEAGNQRLDQLPEYASTVAGLGVQLVTIWQSVAQITRAYGRGAGIVLTNHLSKVFYAGLSDQDSLEYVARVLGEEEVESRDLSGTWTSLVRPQVTDRSNRVGLVQPHSLRQMLPGDALLVHGTLPPAHIRARRWYEEDGLRERAATTVPRHLLGSDGRRRSAGQ